MSTVKALLMSVLLLAQVLGMRFKSRIHQPQTITLDDCEVTRQEMNEVSGDCITSSDPTEYQAGKDAWKAAAVCDARVGTPGAYDEAATDYFLERVGATDLAPKNVEQRTCVLAYTYGHVFNDQNPNIDEACQTLEAVTDEQCKKAQYFAASEDGQRKKWNEDYVTEAFTDIDENGQVNADFSITYEYCEIPFECPS